MGKIRALGGLAVAAVLSTGTGAAAEKTEKKFEWSTKSKEAKALLAELQGRIESFQLGPENVAIARKIVAADPAFAMGHYYLAATALGPDRLAAYEKARELGQNASDGERRFIEAMSYTIPNQGVDFKKSIEPLEAVGRDYPGERLVFVVLGQLYNGAGDWDNALRVFKRVQAIGPRSPRVEAFLASDDLLHGRYAAARATYQGIEKELPAGSVPFAIRFGITFSYLYEGKADEALGSLREYLAEYRKSGSTRQFPEVFIWNAIARINLENGRLDEAMKAYDEGYASVPGSSLPEDQKQTWLGRLHHGKCRVLARMGKHEEAWQEAETVRRMIEAGGQPAEQFWPAYHYLAGYVKLEAGEAQSAVEHLKQADPNDPFHTLLLARAYERLGDRQAAKQAYQKIVDSKWTGIERALAFPEAKRRLETL